VIQVYRNFCFRPFYWCDLKFFDIDVSMTDPLEEARQNIDEINEEIVQKVDKRMSEVMRIIEYKEEHNVDVRDTEREEAVTKQFADRFEELGYPRIRGRQLGRMLIDLAVDLERQELDKRRND
jgi:chorismate mutase